MADVLDVSLSPGLGAHAGWTPRPWDSTFFGLSIAQVAPKPQAATELAETIGAAEKASIDCLYLLADADAPETIRAAEANGFAMVDIRLTLEREVPPSADLASDGRTAQPSRTSDDGDSIRLARPEDLPLLTALARESHRNTRFYQDPRFDRTRSDDLYAVWIERSVRGELADAVWVVEVDAAPRGYLTLSGGRDVATIGLVAVASGYRGEGHGDRLLHTAMCWTSDRGLPRLSVVTQGRNAAAVRFYEKAGFTASRVQLWYHKWLH